MKLKTSFCLPLLFAVSTLGLVGCGGGDSGGVAGDDSSTTPVNTGIGEAGPAASLAISWPQTNAIVDITGTGFYRRFASVMVTDIDGGIVPDGTMVRLSIIDSIMVEGEIRAADGDSVIGTVLTDLAPTLTDGNGTQFDAALATRNTAQRSIQAGDMVLLINADEEDKVRFVGSAGNTTLVTSSAYTGIYPNSIYNSSTAERTTNYLVGASMLGATVSGYDSDGNFTYAGKSTTENGIARFRITYPTNINVLMSGCGLGGVTGGVPAIDRRSLPMKSADVYLVASVSESVTAVSNGFCFGTIAGGIVITTPATATVASGNYVDVVLTLRDGGDTVFIPYSNIEASIVTTGTASASLSVGTYVDAANVTQSLSAGSYITNAHADAASRITVTGGVSGDKITVTYSGNGGATGTVVVTIP